MAKYVKKPIVIEAYKTDKEMIIHTLEGDMKASVGDYIITGVNGEQYPCKPDIFKKTYEPVETDEPELTSNTHFSFGVALQVLKKGGQCAREGWNGKGQYIELATNISYVNAENKTINADHDCIGNMAIAFVGTSGVQLGWLASQSDMLANDWYMKENK